MSIDDQLQKEAEQVIRLAGRKHLKNKLKKFESGNKVEIPTRSAKKAFLQFALAVAAAILILLPLWWFQSSLASSEDQLFSEYFETYRSPDTKRGESPDAEALWKNGAAHYADGNFNSAALKFEELAGLDDNYLIHFYLGQSLLNLGKDKAPEAAAAFQKVLSKEHDYREQAQWYLALALLKSSNIEESSRLLKKISEDKGHYKQEEANRLFKKMAK